MNTRTINRIALLTFALALPALAQSDITPAHKMSWSENCGWMNWRDSGATPGGQGIRVQGTFLSGFVWAENIGYINLGDGTPANGTVYANATGADFGVNVGVGTGNLSGLAWGENVGWINFAGGSIAGGNATAAKFDSGARRFRGYAWARTSAGSISITESTSWESGVRRMSMTARAAARRMVASVSRICCTTSRSLMRVWSRPMSMTARERARPMAA
jgi:hypothetical protein